MVSTLIDNLQVLITHLVVGTLLGFVSLCLWACAPVIGSRKRRALITEWTLKFFSAVLLIGGAFFPLFNLHPFLPVIYLTVLSCAVLSSALVAISY